MSKSRTLALRRANPTAGKGTLRKIKKAHNRRVSGTKLP